MIKLGVNIDHVATLRQARRESEPDPITAAIICEEAGADSIVAHLREDRRHINDKDVIELKKLVKTRFNLEMSINKDIVNIACKIKPHQATLVPEKRKEITTEGGLDVLNNFKKIKDAALKLSESGIEVSLFIDPIKSQIEQSKLAGVNIIELHTGKFALAKTKLAKQKELDKINKMTQYAASLGMIVNAGHGLKYYNSNDIARIKNMHELNIGHSIISHAVFVGLSEAVRQMKQIITSSGKI